MSCASTKLLCISNQLASVILALSGMFPAATGSNILLLLGTRASLYFQTLLLEPNKWLVFLLKKITDNYKNKEIRFKILKFSLIIVFFEKGNGLSKCEVGPNILAF